MVLYGDLFYQNVRTLYQLAPDPTGDFESPGQTTLAIPPHAPGATLGGPTYEETGVVLGAFNPFNPFQQIISGGTRSRLAEFGNRIVDTKTDAFFSTIALKGDKLFDGNWGYDASIRYSQIKNTATGNRVSSSRFNRIMNAADQSLILPRLNISARPFLIILSMIFAGQSRLTLCRSRSPL